MPRIESVVATTNRGVTERAAYADSPLVALVMIR